MFRILSLDGGGIKGAFTASALSTIEEKIKAPVGDYFDLVAGTSTGGILALGIGLGFPAKEITTFYRTMGPKIFPTTGPIGIRGTLHQLFKPRYSHATLRNALTTILGERKFGESRNRLIIPAYDAISGRIFVLKTAHHERFEFDHNALAVDVALATSAAPTYFEAAPFPVHQGSSFIDGGVWANNPVLAAVLEAHHFLGIPLDDIEVLSIGTTSAPFNVAANARAGAIKWNVGMINLMFEAQGESALVQANLLLKGRILRIDSVAKPGEYSLGDAAPAKIDHLVNLGRGETVKGAIMTQLMEKFFSQPKVKPFVPLHQLT